MYKRLYGSPPNAVPSMGLSPLKSSKTSISTTSNTSVGAARAITLAVGF